MNQTSVDNNWCDIFDMIAADRSARLAWVGHMIIEEQLYTTTGSNDITSLKKHYTDGSTEHPVQYLARLGHNNHQQAMLNERHIIQEMCVAYQLQQKQPEKHTLEPVPMWISQDFQRSWHICIVGQKDNSIFVYAAEPYSKLYWQPLFERVFSKPVIVCLLEPGRITEELDKVESTMATESGDDITQENDSIDLTRLLNLDEAEQAEEHTIEQLNRWLLQTAFAHSVSDIHVETRRYDILIRYRIDGILADYATLPKKTGQLLINRMKVVAGLDITETRMPQDGRMAVNKHNSIQEIRVSSMPMIGGEKLVLRIFDAQVLYQPLSDIFYDQQQQQMWHDMIRLNQGLILVTGPTGSGKTTTLYSSLANIHTPAINICTVENPVEMVDSRFNQIQVNNRIDMSFARALNNLLRQDPDVIMIGEIRDQETASIAVRAALTGHLVFATLHTNDALSAIHRMLDLGIADYLLQSTLKGVLAQRLLRRLCDNHAENQAVKNCPLCRGTGFHGRIAVFEMIAIDNTIRQHIGKGSQQDIVEIVRQAGYGSLVEAGEKMVAQKLTNEQEVHRVCPVE